MDSAVGSLSGVELRQDYKKQAPCRSRTDDLGQEINKSEGHAVTSGPRAPRSLYISPSYIIPLQTSSEMFQLGSAYGAALRAPPPRREDRLTRVPVPKGYEGCLTLEAVMADGSVWSARPVLACQRVSEDN